MAFNMRSLIWVVAWKTKEQMLGLRPDFFDRAWIQAAAAGKYRLR